MRVLHIHAVCGFRPQGTGLLWLRWSEAPPLRLCVPVGAEGRDGTFAGWNSVPRCASHVLSFSSNHDQVNTSGEDSKYGVAPDDAVPLATHIRDECQNLIMAGLMTIGQPDYSSKPENFTCLMDVRRKVAEALQVPAESLELSMGMSGDFEQAVEMGSTNIRVGSTIFGARDYANKT